MKNKLFAIFYISIVSITSVYSQGDQPSWVYLKRAENLKEKGEYSQAIIEARKARMIFINEKIYTYYQSIRDMYRDKIEYELTEMKDKKKEELLKDDGYPQFHELMGDLYVLTDFFSEAEKEYKTALLQKDFFEYAQKEIEIKYKVASIHNKNHEYELEDIIYREITKEYFDKKNKEYWERIRTNIFGKKDIPKQINFSNFTNDIIKKINNENDKAYILRYYSPDNLNKNYILKNNLDNETLNNIYNLLKAAGYIKSGQELEHVFRIYRIDGIEYLNALYKIGRRSSLLQKKSEALFYLANAAIVWMTYTANQIKKYYYDFQYASPIDFINYITKDRLYEYNTEDFIMDEILFFIGYIYFMDKNVELSNHYFNLAMLYSNGTKREEEMKKRIEYLKIDSTYIVSFDEFTD